MQPVFLCLARFRCPCLLLLGGGGGHPHHQASQLFALVLFLTGGGGGTSNRPAMLNVAAGQGPSQNVRACLGVGTASGYYSTVRRRSCTHQCAVSFFFANSKGRRKKTSFRYRQQSRPNSKVEIWAPPNTHVHIPPSSSPFSRPFYNTPY